MFQLQLQQGEYIRDTFPSQLIYNRISSMSTLYIVLLWIDGGAFISCCPGSLFISGYFTTEVSRKIIQNKQSECLHMNTAAAERDHLFPQELDSNNMYYVRQRFHPVLNLLSLRNSARCMGTGFVSGKELKSFLRFNITQKHFFRSRSTTEILNPASRDHSHNSGKLYLQVLIMV